ncbi:NCLDV major capsid protein [Klosneuvirus KNV1]|uniref:NCLDV major capsid protein n=1 Tax=Klosneuvirus KNV1 TaxID=1977640 RepID=A0A1V0SHI1_9VIRU|nr:NCLDV major capsid protein [Klosneuvirus KNV1]
MECIDLSLNANPDFGRKTTITVTRNGDLITKMYLLVTLNPVIPSAELGSKFAWVKRLGYALIANVELEIGGSRIDKHYGTWLDIWYELARDPATSKERGFDHMIGDVPELVTYDSAPKPYYKMFIPLKFWFNRHYGLALPLIALQYHEVRLNFEFTPVNYLIVANDAFKANDMRQLGMKDATLLIDYIYLDSEERRRFAQVGHEYLIEQLQFTGTEAVTSPNGKYKLDFNHPSKELYWAMKNGNYITGKKFVFYTAADWYGELENAAYKILSESVCLLTVDESVPSSDGDQCNVLNGESKPEAGEWEEFCPGTFGTTTNGKIHVKNESATKALWVSTSTLTVGNYSLTDKIWADILVPEDAKSGDDVRINILYTDLTVRDLSIPVEFMTDTRCHRDDPCVYEPFNFGILINGEVNPVEWALIQLNGHDRFDRREGAYFNYVQPDQHHTNTPADGINVYSFAIHPEQHQPSGTCNLSRIDNTQLNVWFKDSTFVTGLPNLYLFNNDNQLYIYDFNYNVSNKNARHVTESVLCSDSSNRLNSIATLSNCGNFLIMLILYSSNKLIFWTNSQPIPSKDAVQRLNDNGSINDLRYSLLSINNYRGVAYKKCICNARYALCQVNSCLK